MWSQAAPGHPERFAGVFGEPQIFQGTPTEDQILFTTAAMMGRFFKDASVVPIKPTRMKFPLALPRHSDSLCAKTSHLLKHVFTIISFSVFH
jgi:hypothetical protein